MRALSLSQPWAHVVVHGPKRVENRKANLRGPAQELVGVRIALHAAKSWDPAGAGFIAGRGLVVEARETYVAGAVIGVATIERVVGLAEQGSLPSGQSQWFFGPIGLLLADVHAIAKPIPCRGFLGFWRLPEAIEVDLVAQVREAAGG